MSSLFFDQGDPTAVLPDDRRARPAERSVTRAAVGNGRPDRAAGSHRATAPPARPPQRPDWRLASLSPEAPGVLTRPAAPAPATRVASTRTERRRHRRLLVRLVLFLTAVALAAWLLQGYVAQPFSVHGAMMAPTIQPGDQILVLKSAFVSSPVRDGQIVVIRPSRFLACAVAGGSSGDLALRVVALPGQRISSAGNTIIVNGRPLRERGWFDPRFGQVGSTPIPPTTLAADQYFVLGDDRADACDSRVFGPVARSSIVGNAIAIVVRDGHVFLRTL
jgi:signal peptidase I